MLLTFEQAGTDTLAALVARTIAAAKLKVQVCVFSHGCSGVLLTITVRKMQNKPASTRCCAMMRPIRKELNSFQPDFCKHQTIVVLTLKRC
jgi:hypothetical protein